jgi:hypothetical protein
MQKPVNNDYDVVFSMRHALVSMHSNKTLAAVILTTVQVTKLPLQHKISKSEMICFP